MAGTKAMGGVVEVPSGTATVPPASTESGPFGKVPQTAGAPAKSMAPHNKPFKFQPIDTLKSPLDVRVAEFKDLMTEGSIHTLSSVVLPMQSYTPLTDDSATVAKAAVTLKLSLPAIVSKKIAFFSRWDTVFDILRAALAAAWTALAEVLSCVKAGFYSYDWIRFCYKFCIALNPIYMMVMGFNPEVLRETDFKGAFGCFAMLTWALVMTGRLAYVGTLYTSALTGVVVQYALLQARARYSPDPQSDDEQARESEPSECNLDPCSVSQRGGGKYSYYPGNGRTALDGGCGRCCDLQTTCARGQGKRNNVLAEIMSSECSQQSEQWKPPCLSEVTAALAFCSLPLSVCAIVAQFLVDSVSPLMAPLPAAWCTLLAVCALLPPDRRQMDRPFVIVPTGVMFTWLSLIFIV